MSAADAAQRMAQTHAADVFRGWKERPYDTRQTVQDAAKMCRLALAEIEPDRGLRRLYAEINELLIAATETTYDTRDERDDALRSWAQGVIDAATDWAMEVAE